MPENYFRLQWLYRVNGEIKSWGTWYRYQTNYQHNPDNFIDEVIRKYDLPADADIEITEVRHINGDEFWE